MVNKKAVEEVGFFNPDLGTAEDREFLIRLIRKGSFVYSAAPITQYRWHDDNATQKKHAKRNMENGLHALKLILDNRALHLSPGEKTACNDEVNRAANEYFYICSNDGWRGYCSGFYFVKTRLGVGAAIKALSTKHIVRSLMQAFSVQ